MWSQKRPHACGIIFPFRRVILSQKYFHYHWSPSKGLECFSCLRAKISLQNPGPGAFWGSLVFCLFWGFHCIVLLGVFLCVFQGFFIYLLLLLFKARFVLVWFLFCFSPKNNLKNLCNCLQWEALSSVILSDPKASPAAPTQWPSWEHDKAHSPRKQSDKHCKAVSSFRFPFLTNFCYPNHGSTNTLGLQK